MTQQLNPSEQLKAHISILQPKDESQEVWLKLGHNKFYKAHWDEQGNLSGHLTTGDGRDRVVTGKPIQNLGEHLLEKSRQVEGGAFYIPTQPQGFPLADCVDATDDIGIELDHLPTKEQIALYDDFESVSGLILGVILSSGGKSRHAHLKADQHYPLEMMRYFRRLAIIAFNSDPVTERVHQPMRLAGPYRKEKNAYQTLIRYSNNRYTPEQLTEGFRKWFDHRGWQFPTDIPDQWWSEVFQSLYRSSNTGTSQSKIEETKRHLEEGMIAYLERRTKEVEEAKAKREERRKSFALVSGGSLVDAVKRVSEAATVGDFDGVDWEGGSGHYRGQCPFHQGSSGNSAWLSDKNGVLKFHCSSCTDDNPRDAFEFHTARRGLTSIDSNDRLTKRDFCDAANQYLVAKGFEAPTKPAFTEDGELVQVERYTPHFTTAPDEGLHWITFEKNEETGEQTAKREWIGNHLEAIAYVESPEQDGAAVHLEFKDIRHRIRKVTLERGAIVDGAETFRMLNSLGYQFKLSKKSKLRDYLNRIGSDCETTYILTPKTGWYNGSYVTVDRTYGDQELRFGQVETPLTPTFEQRGTLDEWKEHVAALTVGNSRLTLGLGCSFAGALIEPLGLESGAVHLFGETSKGKTTVATVAGSVFGKPEKTVGQWRATANALEGVALQHNDSCLILDEIGQAHPSDVGKAAYMLANGQAKKRMRRDRKIDPSKTWRLILLSTGEIPMTDYLKSAGLSVKGGQEIRVPSVPACPEEGHGVFEKIHGEKNGADFVRRLERNVSQYYGTAFDAFVTRLVESDRNGWLKRHVDLTADLSKAGEGDEVIGRVAKRFGAIWLALEIAAKYEIIPHTKEQIAESINAVFTAWVSSRGGVGSIEIKQACERIKLLLTQNQMSDRVHDVNDILQTVRNLLAHKSGDEFWVPPSVFNAEFVGDCEKKSLIRELQVRGWLKKPTQSDRNTVKCKIAGTKTINAYVFNFATISQSSDLETGTTGTAGTSPPSSPSSGSRFLCATGTNGNQGAETPTGEGSQSKYKNGNQNDDEKAKCNAPVTSVPVVPVGVLGTGTSETQSQQGCSRHSRSSREKTKEIEIAGGIPGDDGSDDWEDIA